MPGRFAVQTSVFSPLHRHFEVRNWNTVVPDSPRPSIQRQDMNRDSRVITLLASQQVTQPLATELRGLAPDSRMGTAQCLQVGIGRTEHRHAIGGRRDTSSPVDPSCPDSPSALPERNEAACPAPTLLKPLTQSGAHSGVAQSSGSLPCRANSS